MPRNDLDPRYVAKALGYNPEASNTWPTTTVMRLKRVYDTQGEKQFLVALAAECAYLVEEDIKKRTPPVYSVRFCAYCGQPLPHMVSPRGRTAEKGGGE